MDLKLHVYYGATQFELDDTSNMPSFVLFILVPE